jgi:hypothetical protein
MTSEINIVRYPKDKKNSWNEFLSKSKNGLFLFNRDYMEYHEDRFLDFSLMIYQDGNLVALFPANASNKEVISHGGLTFGGLIIDSQMTAPEMLKIMNGLLDYLRQESFKKLIYKCIPFTYHSIPAEEDRYALFRVGARLFRRDVTSAVYLPERIKYQYLRQRCIKKALSAKIEVVNTDDFKHYWEVLERNLVSRHNTRPVHTIEEIEKLHKLFPDNIKLFISQLGNEVLAGIVIYESRYVAHVQYSSNTEEARNLGALDMLVDYLINEYSSTKRYFDFGISTENSGQYLNEGLIGFKEGFGARSVVHDFYEIEL